MPAKHVCIPIQKRSVLHHTELQKPKNLLIKVRAQFKSTSVVVFLLLHTNTSRNQCNNTTTSVGRVIIFLGHLFAQKNAYRYYWKFYVCMAQFSIDPWPCICTYISNHTHGTVFIPATETHSKESGIPILDESLKTVEPYIEKLFCHQALSANWMFTYLLKFHAWKAVTWG